MLKDRGEPVAPWRCSMKYAPGVWNCGAPNVQGQIQDFGKGGSG